MINIEVTGGIKKDRELADAIIWFCMGVLMPRNRTVDITLELTKTMRDGAYGWAYMGDDDQEFIIQVDHQLSRIENVDRFIETICHEMVHVWQMATKRLKDTVRGGHKQLWKCKDGKYRNYGETAYDRQPWETQAYALEGILANGFKIEFYGPQEPVLNLLEFVKKLPKTPKMVEKGLPS